MEKNPRGQRRTVSVADALDRVRWDYRPRGDEHSPAATAGDFFDAFPWEGAPEDEEASAVDETDTFQDGVERGAAGST